MLFDSNIEKNDKLKYHRIGIKGDNSIERRD